MIEPQNSAAPGGAAPAPGREPVDAEHRLRVRIDLGYDGTGFHGWAAQPGLRTVQGELEQGLSRLLHVPSAQVRLTVGGRTDAGVHARGQVAHLDVEPDLLERLTARRVGGVVSRTAPDIVIHDVHPVPRDFDARFSALRRRYEYRLASGDATKDPLTARYTAQVPQRLDLAKMQRSSDDLLGLNDFTAFCKARDGATAIRHLLDFEWRTIEPGVYAARIEADAFCHSMVRALVGAVVAVGAGRIDRAELARLRDARERTSRFTVMPAHGLSLEEISYPADHELAARATRTRARRTDRERSRAENG